MSRVLSVLTLSLVLSALLASCRPPAYVQPTEQEPHAILKVRHIVHAQGGPFYASAVRIGRFSVDERTLDATQEATSTIHLRIRPNADAFAVSGTSYHMEMRSVTRYRSQTETYSCPQQQCSGGYGSTPRNCYTSYRTCTRTRQVPYQSMESVPVTNDACGQSFPLAPREGGTYMLQFDYLGENQCQLTCFEQLPTPTGEFTFSPCPQAVLQPASGRR